MKSLVWFVTMHMQARRLLRRHNPTLKYIPTFYLSTNSQILRFNMGGEACCEIMDMGPGNSTSLLRGKWWDKPIQVVKGGLGLDGSAVTVTATLEQLYRAAELELTAMALDIEDEKERHIMTYMVESGMFSGPGFRLPGASNYIAKVRSDEALKAFYSDYKGDKEKLNRVPCLRQAITLGC